MSPEAVVVVVVEDEFEVEVEVAFEALASSLQEAAWELTRPFQVWGGCLRDEALGGGL